MNNTILFFIFYIYPNGDYVVCEVGVASEDMRQPLAKMRDLDVTEG